MSRALSLVIGAGLLLVGCNSPTATSTKSSDEERVQRAFKDFQQAFETKKADKMWPHLDASTQAAADKAAEAHRTAYAKEAAKEKAEREKKLGLSGDDIAKLTGATYLIAKPFHDKYHDVPEYKIAKYAITGDKATIDLLADDGDKDKFDLVRSGDSWKFVFAIPAE
jgi:hypothetical protein